MKVWRGAIALGVTVAGMIAAPASAQFFLQHYDYAASARDDAAPVGAPLPGATPEEARAALLWNMRAALNVAALQCQFEPTLLTVGNYNAMLLDHQEELKGAFDTLSQYFARTAKTKKEGQAALDQFGTRTYSSFATVAGQLGFCRTANSIGRDALFQPRGTLASLAEARMRELRNSLIPYGEQQFPRYIGWDTPTVPRLDPICWNKKAKWQKKKCGLSAWPTAPAAAGTLPVTTATTASVTAAR